MDEKKMMAEARDRALELLGALPNLVAAMTAFYQVEAKRAHALLAHEESTLGMVRENTRLTLELTRDAFESRSQARLSEADAKRVREAITSGKIGVKQVLAAIAQGVPVATLLDEVLPAQPNANGS